MNRMSRAAVAALLLLLPMMLLLAGCDKEDDDGLVVPPDEVVTLELRTGSAAVVLNGQTTVVATLSTQSGGVAGQTVSFAASQGTITGSDVTDGNGEAHAVFRAGPQAGVVEIRATFDDLSPTTQLQVVETAPGLTLYASKTEVLADGMDSAVITALVTDAQGAPVAPGTAVSFATSRGVLFDEAPTDSSGAASMRLRADRFVTGLARVTAAAAGYQAVTDLAFTSEEASNMVAVETEHAHIYVHASGMRETSTIVFEARDRNGIPVDETHAVTMSFTQDSS
ncbi:MAG: invasin domain 3-containing protein, partial [Candidatus Krumholzibacteriia bacterium]